MRKKQTAKYCFVVLLSLVLILATLLISYQAYRSNHPKKGQEFQVVTSFVPMYTIALNLLDGVEGVSVTNLSSPKTGCLHDYEPTPADLKMLSTCDVFVVNGGGMEAFLDKAREQNENLTIIDTSKGVTDGMEDNAHYWLSVSCYQKQTEKVKTELKKKLESRGLPTGRLMENSEAYLKKLSKLQEKEQELYQILQKEGREAVLLQESFAYLARDLGVKVNGVTDLDEERQVSAKEVASMMEVLSEDDMVWADPVYGQNMQSTLAKQTGAKKVTVDPVTVCSDVDKDTYLERMEENLSTIRKAVSR